MVCFLFFLKIIKEKICKDFFRLQDWSNDQEGTPLPVMRTGDRNWSGSLGQRPWFLYLANSWKYLWFFSDQRLETLEKAGWA